jgi:hypothetical protein
MSRVTSRDPVNPDDPEADLELLIRGYFADQKILAAETRRHLRDHSPIERTPVPGYDGRLFDWLTYNVNHGPPDGLERTWQIILELIARAPDDEALMFVGSGALEDFVNVASERFRDRILDETATSGRFRRAIGCVWYRDDVPSEIKRVVEANRSEPPVRPER